MLKVSPKISKNVNFSMFILLFDFYLYLKNTAGLMAHESGTKIVEGLQSCDQNLEAVEVI